MHPVNLITFAWTCCCLFNLQHSAHILSIHPVESKSHFIFHESVMRSLLAANHRVTLYAPYSSDPHPNLTIINSRIETNNTETSYASAARANVSSFEYTLNAMNVAKEDCRYFLDSEEMKAVKDYDIIFVSVSAICRCYLIFAEKQNIPVIGTLPFRSNMAADNFVGNSRMLSTHPAETYKKSFKMSFSERILNIVDTIKLKIVYFIAKVKVEALYESNWFQKFSSPDPKMSLIFFNNHDTIFPRPKVPNAINIGGIHVKSATLNPLPQDLKKFIDEAEHGVILFSTGTQVRSDLFDLKVRAALKNAFARIPQRVLWKSIGDIDGLPQNVLLSKWFPQKEVLAHKNVIAFISHSGLSSIYESIYFGKPMILIPIIYDQLDNAALLESLSVGVNLNILELTEEKLLEAINEVINGTKHNKNMKELSRRFNDEPLSPSQLVVFWTEYVLRHKEVHLRAAGADLPLHQYLLFDIIAFITIGSIIVGYLSYFGIKFFNDFLTDLFRKYF